jgi:hypothetical protein
VNDATTLLDDGASHMARAFDAPHGAVVAMALKTLAHWSALTGEADARGRGGAIARYRRAAAAAIEAADAPSNDACVSAMCADALLADVQLARAQHLVRVAASGGDLEEEAEAAEDGEEEGRGRGGGGGDAALAAAEAAAAAAVTAAEALGDPSHPRVGLAIACSGDVYACKATAAARRGGGGATGDGAGVVFAEGLYRGALKALGTPRPPTALARDPDAAAGGAASAHLRLIASLVHARYSAVLRASGANRASEAKAWADAAAKEVGPPGRHAGCGAAIRAAIDGFASLGADVGTAGAVIVDAQTMTPMTTGVWGEGDEWRPPFK